MAILSLCNVYKNAPVKKDFTGAPPVHRWCGEIVKYLTLPVSDDNGCPARTGVVQRPLHEILAVVVQGGRGLVEQEDVRISA